MPLATSILVIVMFLLGYWFLRGGSFRLYASAFFGLYYLTGQVWVSVLLIGIFQNIVFLPLRFITLLLDPGLKDFEEKLENTKESDQYLVFTQKVKTGSLPVIFYIFTFTVYAISFFSAGRIFLIDFYTQRLNPSYLYSFIPYPNYPLHGTDFYFPFFKITSTFSLSWNTIFLIWFVIIGFLVALRFIWRFAKYLLRHNQKILQYRIGYNRLLVALGGIAGTLFVVSLIVLRHIPNGFSFLWLMADLTRQNTTMNLITAVATFFTTIHAGYTRNKEAAKKARANQIPSEVIKKVSSDNMHNSFKNAVILGTGAFLITNNIPCAFELSVATFELLYILSPYTFDRFLHSVQKKSAPVPLTS